MYPFLSTHVRDSSLDVTLTIAFAIELCSTIMASTSVLSGNCHCGSLRFQLFGANLELVTTCKCTYCRKAGCLWLALSAVRFEVSRDDGKVARYESKAIESEASSTTLLTHMLLSRYTALTMLRGSFVPYAALSSRVNTGKVLYQEV